MGLIAALNLAMRCAFVLIAIVTLVDYLRRRNRGRLDIHLMFASVASVLLLQLITQLAGRTLPQLSNLGLALFLAQPYLLLRLSGHHRSVPRPVHAVSLIGMGFSWVILYVAPAPIPVALALLIVAYFTYVEGYAAWAFIQGMRSTAGVTHYRLGFAALGSGGLAMALVTAGVAVALPGPTTAAITGALIPIWMLLSALCYYLGFVSPAWLRQSWELAELVRFRRAVTQRSLGDTGSILDDLCAAAVRATGALAACVAMPEGPETALSIRTAAPDGSLSGTIDAGDGAAGHAWHEGEAAFAESHAEMTAANAGLAAGLGATELLAIPIGFGGRTFGLLVVFWLRPTLFPVDAQYVLGLFAERVAVTLRNSELLREQQALVAQLRQSNAELTRATQMKSEFLANMSHELRTPLNAIIGFAELMHDGRVGHVSGEHKELLGDILTSGRHLLQLINDVLDLSKVEAGKMEFHPEPVDLASLVGEIRDILRAMAARNRVHVEVEVDPALDGILVDPAKLKQVLYNYLSNALKFTPAEGRVTVRVRHEGEDAFCLEVEDTGVGIRPEDQPKLFREFQQLDTGTATRHEGTGLGLALTRRIVEAQGGKVGVHSVPGQGSLFYAVLPRRPLRPPEGETPAAPAPAAPNAPCILVVEDDAADRDWLVRTLTGSGFAVEVAANGAAALARCRERQFAAITLDLLLPDTSGLKVLAGIRASSRNADTPVIVVTVVAEKGAVASFPIHDYLTKPVRAEDLLAALTRAGVPPRAGREVLVVDDDPGSRKLMAATLSQLGYRTVLRDGGAAGLQAALELRPAAIVLDLLMPEMDGFEFLARLRESSAGKEAAVIVWTAKELNAADLAMLKLSAQGVVLKRDGRIADLLRELEAHLGAPPASAGGAAGAS